MIRQVVIKQPVVLRLAMVTCVLVVMNFSAAVHAQEAVGGLLEVVENLFGGDRGAQNRPGPARQPGPGFGMGGIGKGRLADVDPDFVNVFTPLVTKVLMAELHFVKKVCNPDDQQFDQIHRAGRLAVAQTSKRYEELQKIRQSASQWPEPYRQIVDALRHAVAATMPVEVSERYGEEVEARHRARLDASVGMMVVHIDSELLLTPDQYQAISETLRERWQDSWSRGPRLFMYPQYAYMPSANVLNPHLTQRQRNVWSKRPNSTTVNFGWQMELGLQDWFGNGLELPAFDKPGPAKL